MARRSACNSNHLLVTLQAAGWMMYPGGGVTGFVCLFTSGIIEKGLDCKMEWPEFYRSIGPGV